MDQDHDEKNELKEKPKYADPIGEMIRKAEKDGQFDHLPGKGKPLKLGKDYMNPSEKQLYKTMKDNHVLPKWVELANEIDTLKEEISALEGEERKRKIKTVNKKIKAYNFACPPSLQRNKVIE
ncbi:MAG: DUF1992 domain-containing protein [Bacillota bacterium]|uniref:DUF1992 domain-containing protein n=2 Tax=Virgibacillus TaxID=84406 RepID=A0A941DSG9_9BACI|nr:MULTISPECIES: DUF1992 domain-containing protein [Bacillaceae]NAZ07299.1 DUF1992 domain-containing protein [Agaribacter marinus]MBR7794577.1 DUF1992 domain-containing protein [Virgibacillus salarius]MCC2252458.1 DUF1992 domain-containing protein [Virgibacillus sp. AGTR]MDY7045476.1 DUF1992 domain-containing protein [Virgibacillus sp. M23]WBX80233.1 DUF1992 domain-containing protein [Virgibacillus salarius]